MQTSTKATDTDAYISGFPKETQKKLKEIRKAIRDTAQEATEAISYGMPAFNLHGSYLVYFAAFKNHIGLYPTPVGIEEFKEELQGYKTGKGSIQFPLDQPLPIELIKKIVQFRMKINLEKMKKKKLKN